MDMSHQIKTLPPEALDILRYFHTLSEASAHVDAIIEGSGLSDRGFGKAIRRLVTKNYLIMDGDQVYRLSDMGKRAVAELGEYDENAPEDGEDFDEADEADEAPPEPRFVRRHIALVAPRTLRVGQPTNVYVGFDDAEDDEIVFTPLKVIVRLSVVHGEPQDVTETSIALENRAAYQVFEVTAGEYRQARLRIQVCQLENGSMELDACGGLYADLPVSAAEVDNTLTAYGTELMLREELPPETEAPEDEFDFE
jgi:hypothetical protein